MRAFTVMRSDSDRIWSPAPESFESTAHTALIARGFGSARDFDGGGAFGLDPDSPLPTEARGSLFDV
ncbi:hypothetical protein A4R35_04585 [Thermogemmatispora tikiterensis]|uniref:Uncharacterized protein n=1 Tax=Thermogemmatispora tikiterensis TaxID=1825093 RepID=A0A328VFH2_9CHLR|nr:hypothetical protein A4R35_04585 [Thermogemmatispora tikiterensis]